MARFPRVSLLRRRPESVYALRVCLPPCRSSALSSKRKFGEPYLPFLEAEDGPIDAGRCGGPRALFVDPLYQLARAARSAREPPVRTPA